MGSLLSLLALASAGLMAGGCATAGLALVGPLAGSLTAIADRSVDRTLPADLGTTWGATADALARMAVRVEQADRSGPKWRLTGTGDGVTVHGALERVTAGMTRVSVRVEAGGLFADKKTGDELLNQVATSLQSLASAGRREETESAERLRGLQREIERLGSRIEQAREAPSPAARPEAIPGPIPSSAPVITIPASAGVATVPMAAPAPAQHVIPSALRPAASPRSHRAVSEIQVGEQERGADDIVAAPMRAVEVLKPVEGLRARPSSQ